MDVNEVEVLIERLGDQVRAQQRAAFPGGADLAEIVEIRDKLTC